MLLVPVFSWDRPGVLVVVAAVVYEVGRPSELVVVTTAVMVCVMGGASEVVVGGREDVVRGMEEVVRGGGVVEGPSGDDVVDGEGVGVVAVVLGVVRAVCPPPPRLRLTEMPCLFCCLCLCTSASPSTSGESQRAWATEAADTAARTRETILLGYMAMDVCRRDDVERRPSMGRIEARKEKRDVKDDVSFSRALSDRRIRWVLKVKSTDARRARGRA
jgi:hypothetical protein